MSDLDKWAQASNETLYGIAINWSVKFTTKQLRAFQASYIRHKKQTTDETKLTGLDNMWQVATWAISLRNFGEI